MIGHDVRRSPGSSELGGEASDEIRAGTLVANLSARTDGGDAAGTIACCDGVANSVEECTTRDAHCRFYTRFPVRGEDPFSVARCTDQALLCAKRALSTFF